MASSSSVEDQVSQESQDTSILLQPPRKWTNAHLGVARVKATKDVIAEHMLGHQYVPEDGDPAFEKAAGLLCAFTEEDIRQGKYEDHEDHPCYDIFDLLDNIARGEITNFLSRPFLKVFISQIIQHPGFTGVFRRSVCSNPPFEIPQFNVKGIIPSDMIITKNNLGHRRSPGVLLILISATDKNRPNVDWYEVPETLLIAAVSYSRDSLLDHYDGFCLRMEGPSVFTSRLNASPTYMRELLERQSLTEDLNLSRSSTFNTLDCDDRRGIVRLLVAVLRYLNEQEQSELPGDYGQGWQ